MKISLEINHTYSPIFIVLLSHRKKRYGKAKLVFDGAFELAKDNLEASNGVFLILVVARADLYYNLEEEGSRMEALGMFFSFFFGDEIIVKIIVI